MSFLTKNELHHFEYSQSAMLELKNRGTEFSIDICDVMIPVENSANTDVQKMGTDELNIRFLGVTELRVIKDGYTVYNLDGSVYESKEDEEIPEEQYKKYFAEFAELPIYNIEKKDDWYYIYLDTEEQTVSYTVEIKAESDEETWERFRRIPAEYK